MHFKEFSEKICKVEIIAQTIILRKKVVAISKSCQNGAKITVVVLSNKSEEFWQLLPTFG